MSSHLGPASAANSTPLGCLPSWGAPNGVFCGRLGTGLPGHSHSALFWQGLKCRVSDLGWAGYIRCCPWSLAPLYCCPAFSGRDSSDSADQTRRSPPTALGRHQPKLFKSSSKQGATSGESAVACADGGAHLFWRTQEACHTGFRGSNLRQPPESPRFFRPPSLLPLAEHHPTGPISG